MCILNKKKNKFCYTTKTALNFSFFSEDLYYRLQIKKDLLEKSSFFETL